MAKLMPAAVLALALILGAPTAHSHGDDPSHSHSQITQKQAGEFARQVIAAMIRERAVGESWGKAALASATKKKRGRATEWVVVFNNAAEPDPAKRTLYVFLDLEGEYLAANHSGR
jgi:hypothetical protein